MPIDRFQLQHLAVPAVIALISFLAYGSQIFLFPYLEPEDLTASQRWKFNILVASIWVSYYRAIRTDPGTVPENLDRVDKQDNPTSSNTKIEPADNASKRQRWCRKCERVKPPRAHHCKVCKRCIPKMDHHCPWTANCVSHFTLPHFMRFLFFATASMIYLQYFLFMRALAIWEQRSLPSYLGPSVTLLILLVFYLGANSLTLFGVGIMFLRSAYDIAVNTTTIEAWEISRHHQLLRRARALGGFLYGPDGQEISIQRQEFPYDIGIWANLCQAMGSANPISWFWVLSRAPERNETEGFVWETNGFEDENIGWPPVDPDRLPRSRPWGTDGGGAFTHESTAGYGELSPREEITAFRQRQEADLQRRKNQDAKGIRRRKRFHDRFDSETYEHREDDTDDGESGEEGWRDSDGSRLKDMGVDEDAEFYDEDDIPLAELLRRKKQVSSQHSTTSIPR